MQSVLSLLFGLSCIRDDDYYYYYYLLLFFTTISAILVRKVKSTGDWSAINLWL